MNASTSNTDVQAAWEKLTQEVRIGVLLTTRQGKPFGSHVAYVLREN